MPKNVGGFDRVARLVAGPVLLLVGLGTFAGVFSLGPETLGFVLAAAATLAGAVLVVTGLTQQCPLYAASGRTTYRRTTTIEDTPTIEDASTTVEDTPKSD